MSDTAAFFANKKKKKKAFKFNANLVDASTVEKKVHVDAPAVGGGSSSAAADATTSQQDRLNGSSSPTAVTADTGDGWDDEALAANTINRAALSKASGMTAEALDMKSLNLKGSGDEDDIAEKLRVEETKAQLKAAKEGMARQAALLKEEKEKKAVGSAAINKPATGSRFASAAASMGSGSGMGGSKWVPPHMRGGAGTGSALSSRMLSPQKLDTENEELFPDLAAADKILEEKERADQPVFRAAKKTPVGGGATWATKKPTAAAPPAERKPVSLAPVPSKKDPAPEAKATPPEPPAPEKDEPAKAPVALKPKKPMKKKKKKKKDLSTFKVGGS